MNVSRRFFLMNTLTVFITVAVTVLAAVVFFAVYGRIYGHQAGIEDLTRLYEIRTGLGDIQRKADKMGPEALLGKGSQGSLAASVRAIGADALLVRNREVLYSTRSFERMDIEKLLVYTSHNSGDDTIKLSEGSFIVNRMDFSKEKAERVSLLLLAPYETGLDFYLAVAAFTAAVFLLVFTGLNLWVSFSLARRVTKPIVKLCTEAEKISGGDLSCEIAEEGDGEVRRLCRTLETMRVKLKEAVYLQNKYDDNRKFLVSSISHDLKTPVTSIKGYIEGILDGVAGSPAKMKEYLETARSKTILVNSMIDDLLLYSRLDLNQIPYDFEKTDLTSYLEYCAGDYRYEFEKANIRLEFNSAVEEPVTVMIDRERMKRVLQNILDNARKYMSRPDGKVTILLRITHTSAIIEIRDNGRGIPENVLPHIFERFYRADASRKSNDGSGLGLAIARQIVEDHEGKIWAVSRPQEGTGIIISLPLYSGG